MNPEVRFSWNIEALDADGRLITRSNGYRLNEDTVGNMPFFYLKEESLLRLTNYYWIKKRIRH